MVYSRQEVSSYYMFLIKDQQHRHDKKTATTKQRHKDNDFRKP